ncbi:MAG: aldolase [Chitinophagaceae bacterium]|nr:aldolase [Chitinophagaceae bacterium]
MRAGEVVSCLKINLADGQVAEIASMSGVDCLWTDREHLAQDWSVLNAQVWASKIYDVDMMVRVPRGSYSDYIKPLEMDATGIMVPHIMSVEDAKQVIHTTRFHPLGLRPIDGGSADGAYTQRDFAEYLREANEQRFIVLQIEDVEPLKELDAIASLPGFDVLFFGPGDFSQSIGAPGNWNHPELIEARKLVAKAAMKHGKFAATSAPIDSLDELIDIGYTFINVGADVAGLVKYCNGLFQKFNDIVASKSNGAKAPGPLPGKPY